MSVKAKRGLSLYNAAHRHPALHEVTAPVLYRAGRLPYATPEQLAQRLARLIPGKDDSGIQTIRKLLNQNATA